MLPLLLLPLLLLPLLLLPLLLLPLLLLPLLLLPLLPLVLPLPLLLLTLVLTGSVVGWAEYVVGMAAGAGVCTTPAVGAAALVGGKLETVVEAGKGGTTVDELTVKPD